MMIFSKMKIFAAGAVIFALVSFGFYVRHIWIENQELQKANQLMEAQIETNETNLRLVVQHLDREAELRIQAEEALSELMKEVPNDEYQQTLPPNIQRVVDNFHRSINRSGP